MGTRLCLWLLDSLTITKEIHVPLYVHWQVIRMHLLIMINKPCVIPQPLSKGIYQYTLYMYTEVSGCVCLYACYMI